MGIVAVRAVADQLGGLDAVTVDSNGTIQVSVPMFYRVRGGADQLATHARRHGAHPGGSFTMGDLSVIATATAIPTNVNVSAFYMDTNLVSYSQWQSVYNWATSHGYGFGNAGAGKAANHPVQTVDGMTV